MKRFDIITEADARVLELGATVELAAGGHVTPLAKDTLAARRVTVMPAGSADPSLPADLAPVGRRPARRDRRTTTRASRMKRAIVAHLRGRGLAVTDVGTDDDRRRWTIRTSPARWRQLVARGEADAGIVIDGAGIGSAIAANKVRGIRAAMCPNETIARYSREHNGANVLTLGSTLLDGPDAAIRIVDTWLGTADARGALHPAPAEDPAAGGVRWPRRLRMRLAMPLTATGMRRTATVLNPRTSNGSSTSSPRR